MGFKNDGLQVAEYIYDFAEDGGATGEIILSDKATKNPIPAGGIVQAVRLKVVTAFTSGGSATMAWGNGDDADGYSGTTVAVASLVDNFLANGWDNAAALLWDDTNDHALSNNVVDEADGRVSVTIATADMTAGKCVIYVEYYAPSVS